MYAEMLEPAKRLPWRDALPKGDCAQVFWHFTDMQGTRRTPWDGRPGAGLPKGFKRNQ